MTDIAKIARAALPFFAKGEVVQGFQRGSKELGCPTANFSDGVVDNLPEQLACGVYCGFANLDDGQLHRMVCSPLYSLVCFVFFRVMDLTTTTILY